MSEDSEVLLHTEISPVSVCLWRVPDLGAKIDDILRTLYLLPQQLQSARLELELSLDQIVER